MLDNSMMEALSGLKISTVSKPRLSTFAGTAKEGIAFDVFEYEVECARQHYDEEEVLEALRRAVRGDAARILMRAGAEADLETVIDKLRTVYKAVAAEGVLLSQFHTAEQKDEGVAEWFCRLETLLSKIQESSQIPSAAAREMLRSRLWTGLKSKSLKEATRHRFDTALEPEELLLHLRRTEEELGLMQQAPPKTNTAPSKAQSAVGNATPGVPDVLIALQEEVKKLREEVTTLRQEQRNQHAAAAVQWQPRPIRCYGCGQLGHVARQCPNQQGNGETPAPWGRR
jgi:hypothetical protein